MQTNLADFIRGNPQGPGADAVPVSVLIGYFTPAPPQL